ncbi:unnamed protein product, partial [Schistosoma turkestanicum]
NSWQMQFNLELLTPHYLNISTMITNAFNPVPEANDNIASCDSPPCIITLEYWKKPARIYGLILFLVALLFTIIVILNKALHSASTRNNIFIILTLIVWIICVGLLSPPGDWKDFLIAANVASIFMILALLLGVKLIDSERKWRIVLFSFCCLFMAAGVAFSFLTVLRYISKHLTFEVLSLMSWC